MNQSLNRLVLQLCLRILHDPHLLPACNFEVASPTGLIDFQNSMFSFLEFIIHSDSDTDLETLTELHYDYQSHKWEKDQMLQLKKHLYCIIDELNLKQDKEQIIVSKINKVFE